LCFVNLCEADLSEADLHNANLYNANLRYANLSEAILLDAQMADAVLPAGETWEEYIAEALPALCRAGGRPLAMIAAAWECHAWTNCPMAVAFGVNSFGEIPLLYQPRVAQFIQFFDARLLPNPPFKGQENREFEKDEDQELYG
jgi:hypothetical protein